MGNCGSSKAPPPTIEAEEQARCAADRADAAAAERALEEEYKRKEIERLKKEAEMTRVEGNAAGQKFKHQSPSPMRGNGAPKSRDLEDPALREKEPPKSLEADDYAIIIFGLASIGGLYYWFHKD